MSLFKRYATMSRNELKALMGENPGANDTYNDTYQKSATKKGQVRPAYLLGDLESPVS